MEYQTYSAKKILNIHKHPDGGWFWVKYSAYPYLGCYFGCEYCYERDEKYLPYICQFIKPDGYLAIADVCFVNEIESLAQVPEFLQEDYQDFWYFIHSVAWWQKLWEKTGLVQITAAEVLPSADLIRDQYIQDCQSRKFKDPFAKALEKDKNHLISFFRLIGQRTSKEAYLQSYKKS